MMEALITFGPANLVALVAIAVIGLPHGAFDGAIAIHLGFTRRLVGFVTFVLAYSALAALVVWVWLHIPAISLLLFLVYSMVHFGLGDARARHGVLRWVQAVAHGGVVVAGISFLHKAETDRIFAFLVGPDTTLVWMGLQALAGLVGAAIFYIMIRQFHGRVTGAIPTGLGGLGEMALLAILFAVTPPLVGFALYFCFVHSARHMRHIWQDLRKNLPVRRLQLQAALFTVASWVVGAVALGISRQVMALEGAVLQVVFIGLAALTVPHMLLVDGLFRQQTGNQS